MEEIKSFYFWGAVVSESPEQWRNLLSRLPKGNPLFHFVVPEEIRKGLRRLRKEGQD